MNPETFNWASLGVGGILAAFVFYFYRQDHARLEKLEEQTLAVLQANTAAMTRLTEAIERPLRSQEAG